MSQHLSPERNQEPTEPELSPGPRTRNQRKLSGEPVERELELPKRHYVRKRWKSTGARPSRTDSEPLRSPTPRGLPSLTWDDYQEEPDFNSTTLSIPAGDLTFVKACKYPSDDKSRGTHGGSIRDFSSIEEDPEDEYVENLEEVFEDAADNTGGEDEAVLEHNVINDMAGDTDRVDQVEQEKAPDGAKGDSDQTTGGGGDPIAEHLETIDEVETFTEDDLVFDMNWVPKEFLTRKLESAEEMRAELRGAIAYLKTHAKDVFTVGLQDKTKQMRAILNNFIVAGQKKLVEMLRTEAATPRNVTEQAQIAARAIKATTVNKYAAPAVAEMQALVTGLQELKFDVTMGQSAFRKEEATEKALSKRIEAAKSDAQRLRSDAVDAGLAEQVASLEEGIRTLNTKHVEVTQALLRQRRDRNLPSLSGTGGGSKSCDIPPPTFGGQGSDKNDFFKFKRDLDEYTEVKNPSKEELVRLVLTKCLHGEALTACENFATIEEIMTHLKGIYGDAKLLVNRLLEDVKKLGSCTGNEEKKRTWCVNVKSKLAYVQKLSKDHDIEWDLYHSRISVEVQSRFTDRTREDFHLILENINTGNEVPQERVFNELLKYLDKLIKRFNFRLKLGTRVDEVEVVGGKTVIDGNRRPPAGKSVVRRGYNVEEQSSGGGGYGGGGGYEGNGGPPNHNEVVLYNQNGGETQNGGYGGCCNHGGCGGYVSGAGYGRGGGYSDGGYNRQNSGGNGYNRDNGGNGGYNGGGNVYAVSTAMTDCGLCSEKHTHLYYCPVFYKASTEDRWGLARRAGICFRCLTMTADVDFDDRKGWFERHKEICATEWACRAGKCEPKPKARQICFLLCTWHAKKNSEMEKRFIQSLDKSLMPGSGTVKFLFNVPLQIFNWNYTTTPAQPTEGWTTLPDVDAPAIYMLAYLLIDDVKFLTFFDSGCMSASISERVKELLRTEEVRPGPTDISVASGTTLRIKGGEERFSIPLSDGKTRCTVRALCMPTVTTPFPVWDTQQAVTDITRKYREFHPDGEPLPVVPRLIGGCPVDIMLGAKYTRWFPQVQFMADCGLTICKSVLMAPGGEDGVLIGPHRSWKKMQSSHQVMRAMRLVYTAMPVVGPEHEPEDVEELDVVEVGGDLFGQAGHLGGEEPERGCKGVHCTEHTESDWKIPTTWEIDTGAYTTVGVGDKLAKFMEGEGMGEGVEYRCPACRNCWSCKQGDKLEAVSLQEEREQYLVQQSVRYDAVQKKIIAELPFLMDPVVNLKPNVGVAKKVFASQLKKAEKSDRVREGIVASHKKLADRGFVVRVADLEPEVKKYVDELNGYVIPWRTVDKESSISTPVRMVFDASSRTPGGESLNNILAKGVNSLGNLFSILMKFRMRKAGFTADVSMAYNGVKLDPKHVPYQKFLWKQGMLATNELEMWVVLTLIYGVKPAGDMTIGGFAKLAELAEELARLNPDLEVALGILALIEEAYMDDVASGQDSEVDCVKGAEQLIFILSLGGMKVKDITYSGRAPSELVSSDGVNVGLLGYLWESLNDVLKVNIGAEMVIGKKVRGKAPKAVGGDVRELLAGQFTRRTLVSKVASIYDPLGLLVPLTAKYKLMLFDVCTLKLDWDDPIPTDHLDRWVKNIEEIQTLGDISFPRTIIPPDAADLNVSYVVSCDASSEIAIACVHSRVKKTDGTYHVQVLVAKSKIVRNLTVPRAELKGAVLAATLGFHVAKNGGRRVKDMTFVTDSSICLYWLSLDQRPLQTGVRNAVLEIRRLTDVSSWRHVASEANVADIGTRSESNVDMTPTSIWVGGMYWMKLECDEMPLRTVEDITLNSEQKVAAAKELRARDVMGIHLNSLVDKVGSRYSFSEYVTDPVRTGWPKCVRVMAMALAFIDRIMKKRWNKSWFPVLPEGKTLKEISCYDDYNLKRAENYFYFKATKEVKQFGKKKDWETCEAREDKILYYVGRILEGQEVQNELGEGLDVNPLMYVRPVCDRYSPVAYAVMRYAHGTLARHRNVAETLRESRAVIYVFGGRDLAVEIRENCPYCRRYKASMVKRSMGKLHGNRFVIAPAFYTVHCDLFGPLMATCEHNHRSQVKVWGIVFKCPSTGAVSVNVMAKYDTAAFLLAYTRHASRYGHPNSLVIDAGSQLVKGCKEMEHAVLDAEDITRVLHKVGGSYVVVAVGSHNQNGVVERSIREVKGLFTQMYKGLKLDILAYETAFAWISSELNNFPQCMGSRTSHLDKLDIITPARLIQGRNNRRCMSGPVTISTPSRLMNQIRETERAWWKVWTLQRLAEFIPKPRQWLEDGGAVGVGDVVLMLRRPKDMAVGDPIWKIGRVTGLSEGRDGRSREARVEYRNASEATFRETTVGVRQLVVLHHESELELVDVLNEAAVTNNIIYSITTSSGSVEAQLSKNESL